MMVIMMVVVMIAGSLGRLGSVCRHRVGLPRRLQQGCATAGAKVIPFPIGSSTRRTRLPRGVFGFSIHIHRFFRILLQREALHRLEGRLVFHSQPGIAHTLLRSPLRTISTILADGRVGIPCPIMFG